MAACPSAVGRHRRMGTTHRRAVPAAVVRGRLGPLRGQDGLCAPAEGADVGMAGAPFGTGGASRGSTARWVLTPQGGVSRYGGRPRAALSRGGGGAGRRRTRIPRAAPGSRSAGACRGLRRPKCRALGPGGASRGSTARWVPTPQGGVSPPYGGGGCPSSRASLTPVVGRPGRAACPGQGCARRAQSERPPSPGARGDADRTERRRLRRPRAPAPPHARPASPPGRPAPASAAPRTAGRRSRPWPPSPVRTRRRSCSWPAGR